MIRIVDIDRPSSLRTRLDCLVIEREAEERVAIPATEIAVLVLSERDITLTSSVLSLLASTDSAILSLDKRFMPVGLSLPIASHSRHTERLRLQVAQTAEQKALFWKRVVEKKIRAQGKHLDDLGRKHELFTLDMSVPEQAEAQAARTYWRALFGPEFSRRDEEDESNALLNYGYAILRSLVARDICKVGLHPALGIFHRNQYNAFVLADDLMEPFRPIIDRVVVQKSELTKENKRELLGAVMENRGEIDDFVLEYYAFLTAQ